MASLLLIGERGPTVRYWPRCWTTTTTSSAPDRSCSPIRGDHEWRDLPDDRWDAQVRTAQGRLVAARETAWLRAREVWVHAVDLGNGGTTHDISPDLLEELDSDVLRSWRRRQERVDLTFTTTGRDPVVLGAGGPTVSGALPDIVRWLTGRGVHRLAGTA